MSEHFENQSDTFIAYLEEGMELVAKHSDDQHGPDAYSNDVLIDLHRAIYCFGQCLELDNASWPAWWYISQAHYRMLHWKEAYIASRMAFKLSGEAEATDGHRATLASDLSHVALMVDKHDEAVYYADMAAELDPDDKFLEQNQALMYLLSGMPKRAQDKIERLPPEVLSTPKCYALVRVIEEVTAGKVERPTNTNELNKLTGRYYNPKVGDDEQTQLD